MNWFVQIRNNDRDTSTQSLTYAAEELGHKVYCERYIPFSHENDLSFLPTNEPVIFHGSIGCARSVQERKLNLKPFAWFDFETLCCHSYYFHWSKYLAVANYAFMPLGELPRRTDWIYSSLGKDDMVFIRPDTNDKLFTGEVVHKEKMNRFMNWVYIENEIPTALCVVGTPTTFEAEWRLFIAEGKVIAGSQYKDSRFLCVDPYCPPESVAFAEKVCSTWVPHPFFCLDVGLTPDGYKVVECGSANCAGFYAADVKKIVFHMSEVAKKDYETGN